MVNYPSGHQPMRPATKKAAPKKRVPQYGSRGMSLEDKINQSNSYYLQRDIAVIHKKPTPIQVVKVNYPHRSAARITEAYYRNASTTDYNGIYKGQYIDFEAKETKNKSSFPLSNLPEHQRVHMRQCIKHGGIAFLMMSFRVHQEVYLLPYERVDLFLHANEKQSLPYEWIQANGFACQIGVFPDIDYLTALDEYLAQRAQKE